MIYMTKNNYIFKIGDTVNETLKIVDYYYYKEENKKGYIVQSLYYTDAPTYSVREYSLINGTGCAYKTGKRIYEGNSLYSVEHTRKYLVDIEESKSISKSNKTRKVKVRCTECGLEKLSTARVISNKGMYCPLCSKGISYPELFILSYLEVKGIKYIHQKGFKDLPRRKYDFYLPDDNLVIEVHGEQHYEENKIWDFSETSKSDYVKERFCLDNNILYLALPAVESSFESLINIVNNSVLPSIEHNEKEDIITKMTHNSKYPVRKMIDLYQKGYSTRQIGERLNIKQATVMYTLKKHNIETSLKKVVRCITTGEEFNSIAEAQKKYPSAVSISRACTLSSQRKLPGTSGKHPKGWKLKWEFVE